MNKIKSVEEIIVNLSEYRGVADTLMILGSGWNHVIGEMMVSKEFDYADVFGVGAGVAGHSGKLIIGEVDGKKVWVMAGRFHTYEGYSSEEVTRPIQAFAELGVVKLVVTAAAGGINDNYHVGDIVVLNDLMTLFCQSPLVGARFQDMSAPFDEEMRNRVIDLCKNDSISYQEGVYGYLRGPHFETFTDKKVAKALLCDCVGMSTVPETIMANALGLKVLGLACVTNLAFVKHKHEDVIAAAESVSDNMAKVLKEVLK